MEVGSGEVVAVWGNSGNLIWVKKTKKLRTGLGNWIKGTTMLCDWLIRRTIVLGLNWWVWVVVKFVCYFGNLGCWFWKSDGGCTMRPWGIDIMVLRQANIRYFLCCIRVGVEFDLLWWNLEWISVNFGCFLWDAEGIWSWGEIFRGWERII